MSEHREELCNRVSESLGEILDGTAAEALFEHVASCDRCRDARHDAEQARELAVASGSDYEPPPDLETRIEAALDARARAAAGKTVPAEPLAEPAPAPVVHKTMPGAPMIETPAPVTPVIETPAPLVQQDTGPVAAPVEAAHTGNVLTGPGRQRSLRRTSVRDWLRRPRNTAMAGLAGAALAAAVVALVVRPHVDTEEPTAEIPWAGKVARVTRAGGGSGLEICDAAGSCSPAAEGAAVPAGARLRTDDRTRAYLTLEDGSQVVLDRGTELVLAADAGRQARLVSGGLVADIAKVQGTQAHFEVPRGRVDVVGTKLAVRVMGEAASVDVSRGWVNLVDEQQRSVKVRSGEEGRLYPGSAPFATATTSLGETLSWSETADDEDVSVRGLGELRAKKPGSDDERQGAVRLESHKVKVRVVDAFARTEIEEVFTNGTDEVLEGIYRFPLPPDAQIERLALDVNGKLEEAAFVDRDRAAAIWRGAIVNASQQRPKPREEIIWVPGPWRDPALLEWQRGGRFELRIFPIPKKGSRRVVISYTQVLDPAGGVRRYVYPLAHDPSGQLRVSQFDVDVQVRGHDRALGVAAVGYAMAPGAQNGADQLTLSARDFVPSGDLVIEYASADRDKELSAWAYEPEPGEKSPLATATPTPSRTPVGGAPNDAAAQAKAAARAEVADSSPYVALAIRPQLPSRTENEQRAFVLVVDSSRSMYGERWQRATKLAARVVREIDPLDRFAVLACDTTCRELGGGLRAPQSASPAEVKQWLEGVQPDGASDPSAAVREAAAYANRAEGRSLRVVYIGDGTPTVGAIKSAAMTRAVHDALPADRGTVTAVAIGADSDLEALGALARGGGGAVLPYVPGQRMSETAFAVLGATYGLGLRDVRVELPDGLVSSAPREIDTVTPGGETIVLARMSRTAVSGDVVLRGRVGGQDFERRYPVALTATRERGNAFVPRLWAAARIGDLERDGTAEARELAVGLSGAFHVQSRHTSLLVLESEQMMKAFGLEALSGAPTWTGEEGASSVTAAAKDDEAENDETKGEASEKQKKAAGNVCLPGDLCGDDGEGDATALGATGQGFGGGGRTAGGSAAGPSPVVPQTDAPAAEDSLDRGAPMPSTVTTPAEPPAAKPRMAQEEADKEQRRAPAKQPARGKSARFDDRDMGREHEIDARRRLGFVPMRRIFERRATIATTAVPLAAAADKIAEAERELRNDENRRSSLKKLFSLYQLSGEVDRAAELAERWVEKEPLDPEALTARADVAARRGRREDAVRMLGSVIDVRPGDVAAQQRLARLERWAGNATLGCRYSIAIAQIRDRDATLLADAVACGRSTGEAAMVDEMLRVADGKVRERAEQLLGSRKDEPEAVRGDVRVTATWEGGAHDLDVALIQPQGMRVSWLGAATRSIISAEDVTSTRREALGVLGAEAGEYSIEVVRASGEGPVRGELTVTAAGATRKIPFSLQGDRVVVGTMRIFFEQRLVPM
jgi:vault protein inter-alpha-trypsin-like protein/VWA domain-containing protein/FecR-like protein